MPRVGPGGAPLGHKATLVGSDDPWSPVCSLSYQNGFRAKVRIVKIAFGLAALLALSALPANAQVSCQRMGSFTNCSDGTSYQHLGQFTYGSDGTTCQRFGSMTSCQ